MSSSADAALGAARSDATSAIELSRIASIGSIVACVPVLLWINRSQWFYFDEWAFIDVVRSEWADGRYAHALFAPHNEHWSTVPILVFGALFKLFGLRTYLPYLAALALLNLTVALLVRTIVLRNGVNLLLATLAGILVMLFGAGDENLVWAFQVGFVGSVAMGLLHLVLVDHDGAIDRRDFFGLAAGAIGLMCSGIAVTMTLVVGLALVLRRRWSAAILATLPLAVSFVVWHRLIGHEGQGGPRPTEDQLAQLPQYVWRGVQATLDGIVQLETAAAVLLAAVIVFLATLTWERVQALAVPLACAAGGVALFVVTGVGRLGFGVEQATSTRYVYIAGVLMLPLLVVAASQLRGRSWKLIVIGLAVWSLLANALVLGRGASAFTTRNQSIRRTILAATEVPGADVLSPELRPDPVWAPNLRLGTLLALDRAGELPGTSDVTDADRLAASGNLNISGEAADGDVDPAPVLATARVRLEPEQSCVRAIAEGEAPQVKISIEDGAELEISSGSEGSAQIFLQAIDGSATAPTPRTIPLPAGTPTSIRFLPVEANAIVTLPPGGASVCGLIP